MKKEFLAIALAITAVSTQAFAWESHYGKVSRKGNIFTCTYTNKTGHTVDMKNLDFSFFRSGGHGEMKIYISKRVDSRVQPGDTVSHSVRQTIPATADYCRYLSR